MGFDLNGLDPYNPNNLKPPFMDWSSQDITEEDKKKYFKASDKFYKDVRGWYFRANVWYWRPIWNFVCSFCDNILSETDMERGNYNDMHKISKTKAKRIAIRLRKRIKDGTAQKYEDNFVERSTKAKKLNAAIQEKLDIISDEAKRVTGDSKLAPIGFPEPYKTQWDDTYAKKSWDNSYPFSVEYLSEFADFCEESGGFEIG